MISARALLAVLLLASALALTGCTSGPLEYRVLVTEPSSNMSSDGQLFLHWSCDASVDPDTRYQGFQDALWHSESAAPGSGLLDTRVSCPSGALLTAQVDASVRVISRPTQLQCEVFDADGQRVADETITRGVGSADPVCRVPVPQ